MTYIFCFYFSLKFGMSLYTLLLVMISDAKSVQSTGMVINRNCKTGHWDRTT